VISCEYRFWETWSTMKNLYKAKMKCNLWLQNIATHQCAFGTHRLTFTIKHAKIIESPSFHKEQILWKFGQMPLLNNYDKKSSTTNGKHFQTKCNIKPSNSPTLESMWCLQRYIVEDHCHMQLVPCQVPPIFSCYKTTMKILQIELILQDLAF
jgi:hypothetical protein